MNKVLTLTGFLKELNISKWNALWTLLFGGWADLAKLICEAFTKLLRKADPAKLLRYSEMAAKIAVFIRGMVEIFVTNEKIKAAALKTVSAIETLAEHLKDGEYTPDELDIDVDNIRACIDAWSNISKEVEAEAEAEADDCPSCHE